MRILLITISFSPNIGGLETYLDDLCGYLTKRKHKIHVISYQPTTTNDRGRVVDKTGCMEVYRIPWFGRGLFHRLEPYPVLKFMYLTPMLLIGSLLLMLRRHHNIDVVHAHGLNAAFIAKALKKMFRKRSVVSIHAVYNLDYRFTFARLVKWVLKEFDMILVPSERSKRDLLAAGISADILKVCSEWVDLNVYKPLDKKECKRELGLEGKFVVLFVGRLLEKKGIQLLLDVASNMDSDDLVFAFVGDGPLSNEIRAKATTQNNVFFGGKVPASVLVESYNAADIVVVPSLYDEVFGRVILEAVSCGTPVVASNKGGIPEILPPSIGRLIEPTTQSLKNIIEYLYKNQGELREMAKNCIEHAETYFSDQNAKIIEESYV